jgi:hypothetical protein
MSSCDAIGSVFQAKQSQVYAQIGIAVMAKGLEAEKGTGGAMVELLQAASDLAKQLGKGLQFDARA